MANRHLVWFITACCSAAMLHSTRNAQAVTFTGVGVYDENVTIISPNATPNQADTDAAVGVGVGTNYSVANFTTDVLHAYNNNLGGVCNFEGAVMTTEQSFDVTYGAAQNKTLTVTMTTLAGGIPTFNFLTGGDAASVPISGTQYVGNSAGGADFGYTFSKPLLAFGYTILSRTANRTVNSMTFTLDDATTYVFSNEAIAASVSGTNGPDDTFFGYAAPVGHHIVSVAIDVSAAVRWDELGFVVKPDAPPLHPGDFDSDGDVDGADFVAWQTHFPTATGATLADGDADADADVDGADFVVWQTNFPFTPGPGATSIPEPMSWVMTMVAAAGVLCIRRRLQTLPK